jgi:hypothetical protein
MAENIAVGTRVNIQTIEGLFTGTVVSVREAYLSELNPEALPNALETNVKEKILQINSPIYTPDPLKIITLYAVQLDDATNYRGSIRDGNIATNIYKFITPLVTQNDTTVQS